MRAARWRSTDTSRQNTARVSWHQVATYLRRRLNYLHNCSFHTSTRFRTSCLKVFSRSPDLPNLRCRLPTRSTHSTPLSVLAIYSRMSSKSSISLQTSYSRCLVFGVTSWESGTGKLCLGVSGLVDHRFLKRRTRCDGIQNALDSTRRGHCT